MVSELQHLAILPLAAGGFTSASGSGSSRSLFLPLTLPAPSSQSDVTSAGRSAAPAPTSKPAAATLASSQGLTEPGRKLVSLLRAAGMREGDLEPRVTFLDPGLFASLDVKGRGAPVRGLKVYVGGGGQEGSMYACG